MKTILLFSLLLMMGCESNINNEKFNGAIIIGKDSLNDPMVGYPIVVKMKNGNIETHFIDVSIHKTLNIGDTLK